MAITDILGNAPLWSFIKDQNVKEIITKQEFRVSEEYLHRELVSRAGSEKVRELSLKIFEGYAEISGKLQQRMLPLLIPFLARLAVNGFEFNRKNKSVHLKVDMVKPMGSDMLVGKLADKIPFINYEKGVAYCDLTKVPLLSALLGYHVKGVPVSNFVTIKELTLNKGEIVGKLGVCP